MDILEFAIKMESDGEQFYLEQAANNKDNGLHTIFLMLAKDEHYHIRILREKEGTRHGSERMPSSTKNVFDGMKDEISGIKQNPEQIDLYRKALDIERKSIDLYQQLQEESGGDGDLYEFLVQQEQEHYDVIDHIIKMVDRPNEWVESAEFGNREEY
ncbi:MAG: ferritin family protein [Clostridia bacterium]